MTARDAQAHRVATGHNVPVRLVRALPVHGHRVPGDPHVSEVRAMTGRSAPAHHAPGRPGVGLPEVDRPEVDRRVQARQEVDHGQAHRVADRVKAGN
jgi:hypothetical protein